MNINVKYCIFSPLVAAGEVNPITLTIVCTPNMLPSHTCAVVTVMYTESSQQQCHPAITQHIITLPLSLFCRPVAPAKNAEHKVRDDHVMLLILLLLLLCQLFSLQITIDTNSAPVSLFTLFPGEQQLQSLQ